MQKDHVTESEKIRQETIQNRVALYIGSSAKTQTAGQMGRLPQGVRLKGVNKTLLQRGKPCGKKQRTKFNGKPRIRTTFKSTKGCRGFSSPHKNGQNQTRHPQNLNRRLPKTTTTISDAGKSFVTTSNSTRARH